MALIKCPECGKEISDKALACIHCGFPLSLLNESSQIKEAVEVKTNITSEKRYSLELLDYGNKKVQVAMALKNVLKMKDAEALELVASAPCYLFKEKKEHIIVPLIQKLDALPIEYNLYVDGVLKGQKTKVEIDQQDTQTTIKSSGYTTKIKCPNCASLIPETSRICSDCGFDGIGSYLLQLEKEKQSEIIDYAHNYEPINNIPNVPECPTCSSIDI